MSDEYLTIILFALSLLLCFGIGILVGAMFMLCNHSEEGEYIACSLGKEPITQDDLHYAINELKKHSIK